MLDIDCMRLADTMDSVDSYGPVSLDPESYQGQLTLVLDGRVPPAIHHEDVIGVGKLREYKTCQAHSSCRTTRLTFRPTPPAFKLTIRTLGSLDDDLNPDTASLRLLMSMVPSNLYQTKFSRSKTV